MSIIINTLQTQPVDTSEDLTLIPPGGIKVSDKTGNDLYALRFNTSDLTGTLDGAISAQGTGEYTSGILFQDNDSNFLDGNLIFSSGKMKLTVAGQENVGGICGAELTLSGKSGASLTGTLNASAKSDEEANASGIYADVEFTSVLELAMTVKADASKGADASVAGIDGETQAVGIGDKFKLNAQAKAGSGEAEAIGFNSRLTTTGALGGTIAVAADASKGTAAFATGVYDNAQAASVSDKFKLTVSAKSGSEEAEAQGFKQEFGVNGTLGGTMTVTADSSKGTDATAVAFASDTAVTDISDKFKLTVQSKSGLGKADAAGALYGFQVGGTLGGTMTITADSSKGTDARAAGFYGILGIARATVVSDQFKLTVTAKSGTGSAEAQGFAESNFPDGLSGKISVSAVSKTGDASALGGNLSSSYTFRTATANVFSVTAQSQNTATATGLAGDGGEVKLKGVLAVQAKGVDSTAYGIDAGAGALTGYIGWTGSVAAVGNTATGVSGGDASWFTVYGGLYAGTKGSAAGIAKSLGKSVGTGKSASGLNKNAGQAISLGSNSTLTISDGAVVIGDVTLGGTSMMEISTGAQLYGDIDMSGSGIFNIYIGGSLNKAATITLNSDDPGIFTKSSGVTLTVTATELTETGSYVLLAGSDLSGLSGDYDTLFEELDFASYGLQAEWQLDLSGKTDTLTLILSDAPVGSSSALLSATDLNSADRMLASSSLTDQIATSDANAWKTTLIA